MKRVRLFSDILDEVKSVRSIEDAISILEGLAVAEVSDYDSLYLCDHKKKIKDAIEFTRRKFKCGVIR
jgi:hypothetical protein